MVKIFVGNLPREYGTVTECAIIKNYAFVHMDDRKAATKAIKNLHLFKLHGTSTWRPEEPGARSLRGVWHGHRVCCCQDFAFVHMSNSDEAWMPSRDWTLNFKVSKGHHVKQVFVRFVYRGGYWPPRYPGERHEPPPPSYLRGRLSHIPQVTQPLLCRPLPPRRAVYPDRPYEGERDRYGVVDYYEKYRARPYGMASYEDQRAGVPSSPSPSAVVRDRLMTSSLDPYDRRPLPPPPSSYYARDRSPLRRAPSTPMPPASNGYSYERSRLSPVSRVPAYGVPRARDPLRRPAFP
uniref:RNA binding motif protein 4.3 n=1 Tax=Lates calcarifer TaxID=8187 RepID=A0A4W6D5S6_LATCA